MTTALLDTGCELDLLISVSLVNEKEHMDESVQVSFVNVSKETSQLGETHLKSNFFKLGKYLRI